MGLIQCPDCGNWISEHALACPSCGCPANIIQGQTDYQNNGESGGGILNSILSTAVGVALGKRISENRLTFIRFRGYMSLPSEEGINEEVVT